MLQGGCSFTVQYITNSGDNKITMDYKYKQHCKWID